MKKNGFTLVELLASLTILGVLMVVTVPNVVGILSQNRDKTYVEDAKKMISAAKYKFTGNNGIIKPGNGQCIVISLGYLDNAEFENPPNEGEYSKEQSYVVIKRTTNKYEFYARIVERLKDDSLYGIEHTIENQLEDGVKAQKLTAISDVNVASIDKNYFQNTFSCTVSSSYFKIDEQLNYN